MKRNLFELALIAFFIVGLSGCSDRAVTAVNEGGQDEPTVTNTESESKSTNVAPELQAEMEKEFVPIVLPEWFVIDGPPGAELSDGPPWDLKKGEQFNFRIHYHSDDQDWVEERKQQARKASLHKFLALVEEGPDFFIYKRDGYRGPEYAFSVMKIADKRVYEISNASSSGSVATEEQVRWLVKSANSLRALPDPEVGDGEPE